MSSRPDNKTPMTTGDIIRLAFDHRENLKKEQDAVKTVAGLLGKDERTIYRWLNNDGVPDVRQFGIIMSVCVYPEGFDHFKDIVFPQLRG